MTRYKYKAAFTLSLCVFVLIALLCSCSTIKSKEFNSEHRTTDVLTEKLDSVISRTDNLYSLFHYRQSEVMKKLELIEKNDTSRTIILGEKGDTIRENTIIYVERSSKEDNTKVETETTEERLNRTDSLLRVCISNQEKTDEHISELQKDTVMEKKTPWYKRFAGHVFSVLFGAGLMLLAIFIKRKSR